MTWKNRAFRRYQTYHDTLLALVDDKVFLSCTNDKPPMAPLTPAFRHSILKSHSTQVIRQHKAGTAQEGNNSETYLIVGV